MVDLKVLNEENKLRLQHRDAVVMQDPHSYIRACEDLFWNHDKSALYQSKTNIIVESAARKVKEGPPFRKSVGEAMECFCFLVKHTRQTGRQEGTV